MPYTRGEYGDFASVQMRGDSERLIARSLDGKMVRRKVFIVFVEGGKKAS